MSNYFTKKALISAIKNSATLINLSFNEESSVVISEYGGRPMGMFPKNDNYSLLWIAPNIKENIERRDRTIGGDRYWISPERDFFYKNPTTLTTTPHFVGIRGQLRPAMAGFLA